MALVKATKESKFQDIPLIPSKSQNGFPSFITRGGKRFLCAHLHRTYDERLLKRFHSEIMTKFFPIEEELDPIEAWIHLLKVTSSEEEMAKSGLPAHDFLITILLDPDVPNAHELEEWQLPIASGSVVEYYHNSQCAMMTYILVVDKYRHSRAFDIFDLIGGEAIKCWEQQKQRRLLSSAPKSGHHISPDFFAFLCEANALDVEDGVMPSKLRHERFYRQDLHALAFDYIQPPVEADADPCAETLLFCYVGPDHKLPTTKDGQVYVPSHILRLFLRDYSICSIECTDEELEECDWWQHMMNDMKGREAIFTESYPWTRFNTFRNILTQRQKAVEEGDEDDDAKQMLAGPTVSIIPSSILPMKSRL